MDTSFDVLHAALNGLMARQQVIANNIANVATPGFTASQVDFESALRTAMAEGSTPPVNPAAVTNTSDPANQAGNNVNLDAQTLSLAETELRYQAVVGAVNSQFRILKTAIQG